MALAAFQASCWLRMQQAVFLEAASEARVLDGTIQRNVGAENTFKPGGMQLLESAVNMTAVLYDATSMIA